MNKKYVIITAVVVVLIVVSVVLYFVFKKKAEPVKQDEITEPVKPAIEKPKAIEMQTAAKSRAIAD